MKKFLRLFSAMLSLIIIFGIATQTFAFDQGAAQRYADQYVFNYNKAYRNFKNADCTNFVSQCLYAGGLNKNSSWNYSGYYQYTSSWAVANDLKNYLVNQQGASYIGRWRYKAGPSNSGYWYSYVGVNNSSNIQGLGSEVIFYDWYSDGIMDHAAIVVGTNYAFQGERGEVASFDYKRGYGDLINQHTTNRRHQIWNLDEFNYKRKTTSIYAYRV